MIGWSEFLNNYGHLVMSRDSDLTLYVNFNNVNKFNIYNIIYIQ